MFEATEGNSARVWVDVDFRAFRVRSDEGVLIVRLMDLCCYGIAIV